MYIVQNLILLKSTKNQTYQVTNGRRRTNKCVTNLIKFNQMNGGNRRIRQSRGIIKELKKKKRDCQDKQKRTSERGEKT